jgi:CBS domain containing-hemolysin-like protein
LDVIIGDDSGLRIYSKRELATMMTLQHEEGQRHGAGGINYEEIAIIGGALKFRDMKVSEVMTRKDDIFMVSMNETLSYKVNHFSSTFHNTI